VEWQYRKKKIAIGMNMRRKNIVQENVMELDNQIEN
jgi:hypothetical protein